MMNFKLYTLLCVVSIIPVQSLNFFGITNGYRHLVEEIKSITKLLVGPIFTRWIEQKVDHFDSSDTRTWKMRYYERFDFWRPLGPVYLYIGGESEAEPGFLKTGVVYDLAKETNGAMFMSEHRYYGKSRPVNRTGNVEDFRYLSVAQALADIAVLLRSIKKSILFKFSKIVVVGGSYAGNLAAWMKLVYPELVDAAIASSGPVEAKRDFYEYLEVVSRDYKKYGTEGCWENIQKIFQRYEMLLKSSDGIKQLKKEESICNKSDLSKPENKHLFFLSMASVFMSNAQYGTIESIKNHCSIINNMNDTDAQSNDEQNNANQTRTCTDYDFNAIIQAFQEEDDDWSMCWTYQTCTELGYFQSTTSDNQPFTKNIPVEFYDKLCSGLFGVGFDKGRVINGVQKINKKYGGKSPNVTEVVFVNGELDPWSALGILEDLSYKAPAIYIPRSSHCRDLFSDAKGDDEELKEARKNVRNHIKFWIGRDDFINLVVNPTSLFSGNADP